MHELNGEEVTGCNRDAECGQDECCEADFQPIGRRRKRQADEGIDVANSQKHSQAENVRFFHGQQRLYGHCARKPRMNEKCIDLAIPNQSNQIKYACPCQDGSKCVRDANALLIVPLGYQGSCVKEPQNVTFREITL